MIKVTDDLGNRLTFNNQPKRIISCVPSLTELLADLEQDSAVIGVTKFCVHPKKWFQEKTRIGGTKNLNLTKIIELKPDFIIASKEENTQVEIEQLQQLFPVYISDISNWSDCIKTIETIAKVTGKSAIGNQIIHRLNTITFPDFKQQTVAYIIWNNPIMTIGGDTFIDCILDKVGLQNIYKKTSRYPVISLDELKEAKPDYLFLSSEPFPFKEKHLAYYQAELPDTKVLLVDGEIYSWYGTRLLEWHKKR